ncbi:MAG: hypothetical protein R3F19_15030 [Verrucomicrobiales bacterium]
MRWKLNGAQSRSLGLPGFASDRVKRAVIDNACHFAPPRMKPGVSLRSFGSSFLGKHSIAMLVASQ